MLRRIAPLTLAVSVAAALIASPASAQRLVYGIGGSHGSLDLTTGVTTPLSADEAQLWAVITSDGRIAVQSVSPPTFSVRDLTTGQQFQVAAPFLPLVAHPRRLAVFGLVDQAPARLDARGVVPWNVCGPVPFGTSPQLDLSINGDTLFVLCAGTLLSLDSDTGVERGRVPMTEIIGRFAVNAAGTEVVGWNRSTSPELVRVDLATGAVLQRRAASVPGEVMPTPARDRVIATFCRLVSVDTVCTAMLVDAASLADISWLGEASGLPWVEVSPDGRDAFMKGFGYTYATVFAQWTGVAKGLAPGTTALTLPLGTTDDLTFPGVPTGRYYVRVRALSVNGVSAPSNEIVVDVP